MIDHNLKKIFRMTGAQSAAVISPLRVCAEFYVWRLGGLYQWSHTQVGWMFTLFVIFESIGTLLGGVLRDLFGPRWVTIIGLAVPSAALMFTLKERSKL